MNINKISLTNFNKYSNVEYSIEPFNVIRGLNGAGKSSIIEGINFALLGKVKKYKKNEEILNFSYNGKDISSTVFTSNGSVTRALLKKGKSISEDITIDFSNSNTIAQKNLDIKTNFNIQEEIFSVSNFINLTAQDKSKYILSLVQNSSLSKELIVSKLKAINLDVMENIMEIYDDNQSVLDNLDSLFQFSNSFKNSIAKEIRESKENMFTIADVRKEIENINTTDFKSESELEKNIQQANVDLKVSSKRNLELQNLLEEEKKMKNLANTNITNIDRDISKYKAELDHLYVFSDGTPKFLKKIQETNKIIEKIKDKRNALKEKSTAAQCEMNTLLEEGKKVAELINQKKCVVNPNVICASGNAFQKERSVLLEKYTQAKNKYNALVNEFNSHDVELNENLKKIQAINEMLATESEKSLEVQQKIKSLNNKIKDLEVTKNNAINAKNNYKKITDKINTFQSVDTTLTQKLLLANETKLADIQKRKKQIEKLNLNLAIAEKEEMKAEEREQKLSFYKEATSILKQLKLDSIDKETEQFIDTMNSILSEINYKKKAFIKTTNKKVVFGFLENKKEIFFDSLSTGESIVFLIGLLGAIYSSKSSTNCLRYLALDDIDNLDSNNFDLILRNAKTLNKYFDNILLVGVLDKVKDLEKYSDINVITVGDFKTTNIIKNKSIKSIKSTKSVKATKSTKSVKAIEDTNMETKAIDPLYLSILIDTTATKKSNESTTVIDEDNSNEVFLNTFSDITKKAQPTTEKCKDCLYYLECFPCEEDVAETICPNYTKYR